MPEESAKPKKKISKKLKIFLGIGGIFIIALIIIAIIAIVQVNTLDSDIQGFLDQIDSYVESNNNFVEDIYDNKAKNYSDKIEENDSKLKEFNDTYDELNEKIKNEDNENYTKAFDQIKLALDKFKKFNSNISKYNIYENIKSEEYNDAVDNLGKGIDKLNNKSFSKSQELGEDALKTFTKFKKYISKSKEHINSLKVTNTFIEATNKLIETAKAKSGSTTSYNKVIDLYNKGADDGETEINNYLNDPLSYEVEKSQDIYDSGIDHMEKADKYFNQLED